MATSNKNLSAYDKEKVINGNCGEITGIISFNKNQLVSASLDGLVKLWDF